MRRWSPLAKWKFREYNEVEHLLEQRLNSGNLNAETYLNQFPPSKILVILCRSGSAFYFNFNCIRFVSFVLGSLVVVLIGLTLINSDFVFELWGFSSVFYLTILTVLLGIVRVTTKFLRCTHLAVYFYSRCSYK